MVFLERYLSANNSNSKGIFCHTGKNSRQGKFYSIMRSPDGNAQPIKALFLLAEPARRMPGRLNIIFDLEWYNIPDIQA
jgi:hypothetical protein